MPTAEPDNAPQPPEVERDLSQGETPRRRPLRRPVDLSSLYEAVDQPRPAAAPVIPEPAAPAPSSAALPEPQSAPAPQPAEESGAPRPRPARRPLDLAALYDEVDTPRQASEEQQPPAPVALPEAKPSTHDTAPPPLPAASEEPPRRRPVRGLPDLASLYEAVDTPRPSETAAPVPTVTEPPAPRRKPADLSFLDEIQTKPAPAPSTAAPVSPSAVESETSGITFPPETEKYISPDLWRKINSPNPPRGVLINTLERLRSVFSLLSTFLPQHLVQEKMRRAVPGLVSGQMLRGTLLFSDVSGFTALSERLQALGPQGAEQMTEIMNRYFARMLEITACSGGTLLKFAGDAMLIYFPQQENDAQASWAVRAGQRMLNAMTEFADLQAPGGKVSLKMKIGVGTGEYLAASVGSDLRMEYVVLGSAVAQTMTAESLTTAAGQVVVNPASAPCLDAALPLIPHKNGYFRLNREAAPALDDFEVKAETRRARGAISWDASPRAIVGQAEVALRQIQAILPYLSPEVVERLVVRGQRTQFASQYRPTAVLFCNFWGVEALLTAWGAEGVSRVTGLLNAYFTAMNEVVTHYGGIISRIDPYSRGTKMLILFGAPVAHEDDPQRAVSAALAMNAELETLNETWRGKLARHLPAGLPGSLIQHRIGITCGDTFAGQVGSPTRREYTVMGDQVNLSARLMGAADPSQILAHFDLEVHKTVAAAYHLSELSPIRVKGKSRPISVFQVQGPRDDLLANRARSREPFIGRRDVLARAEAVLNQALDGRGAVLTLQGPAGMGKSHLADVLVQRAEARGAFVLFHACRSYAVSTPYACWSLLLRSLCGITATDYQPEVHHEKLNRLLGELGLPATTARPLAMLMGLKPVAAPEAEGAASAGSPESGITVTLKDLLRQGGKKRAGSRLDLWDQLEGGPSSDSGQTWQPVTALLTGRERDTVYGAIWSLLEALFREQAGMIFFEDAHWMDPPSLDLLDWLGMRIRGLPLLVLLAQRSSEARRSTDKSLALTLAPLGAEDTGMLVAHLLTRDLAPVIHEQSQGNPLFVEEITRWFRRTRHISADELRSVLQTSNFLQKLVLSGVESLPEDLQEIAMAASVIGAEFRTGEVQALLPATLDAVTLSNHLRALARTDLISLAEAGADARYVFQQGLVRDILYNSLPFEKRRELHGHLADYLSRPLTRRSALQARLAAALDAGATRPGQTAEIVAGHYEQAERWLAAAQHWDMAGSPAGEPSDPARANGCFTRALTNLEKIPPGERPPDAWELKIRLHTAQGDLALRSGDYLAATTAYEAARACPGENGGDARSAALIYRLALVLPTQRRAEEAQALLSGLLAPPGYIAPPHMLATMAWLARRAGQADAAQWAAQCEARLEAAGSPNTPVLRALLADFLGDWDCAREAYLAIENAPGAALADIRRCDAALAQGNFEQAQAAADRAYEISLAAQEPVLAALACYRQTEIAWRRGSTESARSALSRIQPLLDRTPGHLAAEGMAAARKAYKIINLNKFKNWQYWLSQNITDWYTIKLLFLFV